MATNTNLTVNEIPHRLMDINLLGSTNSDGTINSVGVLGVPWDSQVSAKGTVGTNLDVTPTAAGSVFEMIISAPSATDGATIAIYSDTVSVGNRIFNGYLRNLDGDNSVKWPTGESCTAKWIVVVTGGSGDLYALARYR